MLEQNRDLLADLKICKDATPGPVRWQKFGKEYYLTGQYGNRPIILGTIDVHIAGQYCPDIHISNLKDGLLVPVIPEHPDSKFIQEAWTGWEHALNRAIVAEFELERLRKKLNNRQFLAKVSCLNTNCENWLELGLCSLGEVVIGENGECKNESPIYTD